MFLFISYCPIPVLTATSHIQYLNSFGFLEEHKNPFSQVPKDRRSQKEFARLLEDSLVSFKRKENFGQVNTFGGKNKLCFQNENENIHKILKYLSFHLSRNSSLTSSMTPKTTYLSADELHPKCKESKDLRLH